MLHVLKSASTPIVWVLALVALGLILARCLRKRSAPRLGWFLVLLGMLVLYLFSITPVSRGIAYSLESRYKLPSDQVLSTLDLVVILGGGIETSGGLREYPEPSGITYSRLVSGVRIFKRSGAKTLVLSGGGPTRRTESEAGVMKDMARELGIQEDSIIVERDSRNTMEQAVKLGDLLSATGRRRIGLVTSAMHMLRSERTFKVHFPDDIIVPIPVDHHHGPPQRQIKSFIPSVDALSTTTAALHEWIGMIWYKARY